MLKHKFTNNSLIMTKKLPGFFSIVIESKSLFWDAILGSHQHRLYPDDEKDVLVKKLGMEEVTILLDLFFVSHGFLQHANAKQRKSNAHGIISS